MIEQSFPAHVFWGGGGSFVAHSFHSWKEATYDKLEEIEKWLALPAHLLASDSLFRNQTALQPTCSKKWAKCRHFSPFLKFSLWLNLYFWWGSLRGLEDTTHFRGEQITAPQNLDSPVNQRFVNHARNAVLCKVFCHTQNACCSLLRPRHASCVQPTQFRFSSLPLQVA